MAKVQSLAVDAIPKAKPRPRLISLSLEDVVLFASSLGIYLTFALYLRSLDIFIGDAVARTANAFWVLFSRDPHLGAIGFVWNPLPSLMQLPLVAALRLLHVDVMLAGNLMSAACGATTLATLNVAIRRAGLRAGLRWPVIALYGLNPMIMFYSANGMSEAPFIACLVLAVVGFIWWSETHSLYAFTLMAFVTALALWVRYEALALTAAIAFSLVPMHWPLAKYLGIDLVAERIEAHITAYLSVAFYFFGLWVFFNWMIMGNPFYFLFSPYGNIAQTVQFRVGGGAILSPIVGSIVDSLRYGLQQSLRLFPAFVAIALLALFVSMRHRHVMLFCILLIFLSIPLFEIFMIYRGSSFGWLRFFMYGIPFSYLLLVGLWSAAPELFRRRGVMVWAIIFIALLLSNVASWFAMDNPHIGREEYIVTRKLVDPSQSSLGYSLEPTRKIANYIAQFPPEEKVLMDSALGYAIPLLAPDPTRFVVTSDRDFELILAQPYGNVTYILVPKPEGLGANDRINREYLDLWKSGTHWTELVKEFEDMVVHWKLYRVIGEPPRPPTLGATGMPNTERGSTRTRI
jgi:hypothetical protein